jgi:hypothetical protein
VQGVQRLAGSSWRDAVRIGCNEVRVISVNPDSGSESPADAAALHAAPQRGSRFRSIMIGAALGLVVAVAAVLAYMLLERQPMAPLAQAAYDAAVQRWERHAPAGYNLDVELTGNRPGKIHVEVRDGQAVHMTRDGVEPRQQRTWFYWTVPGMLDTIGQELEMARDPAASFHSRGATQMVMWAEFDPKLGIPRKYDRVVLGDDFEVHWRVVRFEPLTPEK